MTKHKSETIFW